MSYTMNEGQLDALRQIENFLIDPTKQFMVLSGMAGTGKSVVIGEFINSSLPTIIKTMSVIDKDYVEPRVIVSSTTNESARALEKYLTVSVPTIYSVARMYPGGRGNKLYRPVNSSPGDCGSQDPKCQNVVIIDEYSYIDKNAFELIITAFPINTKYLFIGDSKQLSAVDSEPYLLSLLKKDSKREWHHIELTKVERSTDEDITNLVKQLYTDIDNNKLSDIFFNGSTITNISTEEFNNYIRENNFNVYGSNKDTGGKDERILSYDNRTVTHYGNMLREARKLTPLLVPGEILVNTKYVAVLARSNNKNTYRAISTRQELEVISASNNTSRISLDLLIDESITMLNEAMGSEINLEFIIQNIRVSEVGKCGEPININYLPNREPLDNLLRSLDNRIRSLSKQPNAPYDKINLLSKVHKMLFNLFPNIKPAEVITIHSSQGSSYDNVYILLDTLDNVTTLDPALLIRLLYVSASRARENIIFVGDIPQRVLNSIT